MHLQEISILHNCTHFCIIVQNHYNKEYWVVLHSRTQEPSDWCFRVDLWRTRMKKPLFLPEICTGLLQTVIFLCLHEALQSEQKISSFTSIMHRGSVNVNGNPSWGLNTTWERKIGADLRAKFSPCSLKGCFLQDARENAWWMPLAVFLHNTAKWKGPVFLLPRTLVQPYPWGEPHHNASLHRHRQPGLTLPHHWQFTS